MAEGDDTVAGGLTHVAAAAAILPATAAMPPPLARRPGFAPPRSLATAPAKGRGGGKRPANRSRDPTDSSTRPMKVSKVAAAARGDDSQPVRPAASSSSHTSIPQPPPPPPPAVQEDVATPTATASNMFDEMSQSFHAHDKCDKCGSDQMVNTYWQRIKEYFDERNTSGHFRSSDSLRQRWSTINAECQKWAGCLSNVARMNPSGCGDSDLKMIAQGLFQERNMKGEKKKRKGKAFTFHHCYKELKDEEKWRGKKERSEAERRRAAAEEKRAAAEERLAVAEERKVDLEEKKAAVDEMKMVEERTLKFMFMDTSTLDAKAKAYVELCRDEIFMKKQMLMRQMMMGGGMGGAMGGGMGGAMGGAMGGGMGGGMGGYMNMIGGSMNDAFGGNMGGGFGGNMEGGFGGIGGGFGGNMMGGLGGGYGGNMSGVGVGFVGNMTAAGRERPTASSFPFLPARPRPPTRLPPPPHPAAAPPHATRNKSCPAPPPPLFPRRPAALPPRIRPRPQRTPPPRPPQLRPAPACPP
nr:uncharacterized protein LOC109759594 [Aegilops tauschii subsp. strangulata]